jgi:multisubunit Na+/H+ antiporter MnhE subunit
MMINSLAFGLFLISVVIYYVLQDVLATLKNFNYYDTIVYASNIAVDICNTFAQVVLCVMFKNIENDEDDNDESDD